MKISSVRKFLVILIVPAVLGCQNTTRTSSPVPPELKMVSVPSVISDPSQINKYVAEHFWDGVDFTDSLLLLNKPGFNRHYNLYLDHIMQCPYEVAEKSVKNFILSVLNGNEDVRDYITTLTEKVLYDPNSQHRNEDIYLWVLEIIINEKKFDPLTQEKYKSHYEMSMKNRPGETATDFAYITADGKEGKLKSIKGEYTLLFFYDPDCHSCEYALDYIQESSVIKSFTPKITKLAVYTGENAERWINTSGKFSKEWIVAFNNDFSIERDKLYDRRATPYIYLLDKEKRVILKDITPAYLEQYLSNITRPQ